MILQYKSVEHVSTKQNKSSDPCFMLNNEATLFATWISGALLKYSATCLHGSTQNCQTSGFRV